ncbi:hypothetical protein FA95DRAFT_1600578 [Auriscalpium vulgare]|uniref:Uncharacterized protein n=1 Tax=Auriscalpium vulgare TaxID=40419 RepID=A0ACB8SDN8_9AGAM|nr:hypothetical protein FA95DRAFT_1600578 [Auriscalpium vulgare]
MRVTISIVALCTLVLQAAPLFAAPVTAGVSRDLTDDQVASILDQLSAETLPVRELHERGLLANLFKHLFPAID